ncbi:MAG: DHH family phosphoesterase, partial [Chloroflexi bacterium]|nr:DHH family phosphoesterase [Chloroflexota bacterium]
MGSKKWQLFPPIRIEELARFAPLPSLVVQLLYNRGLSPSQFESFLEIDDSLLADPFLLPDMEVGVSRLCQALTRQEKIAVYGDFDVDGIAATVLLSQGLAALGAQVTPYIPHRFDEGYGLNHGALARLAQEGVKLVITVDCGISDFEEVERAQGMGLDIIITDHHT